MRPYLHLYEGTIDALCLTPGEYPDYRTVLS